MSGGQVHLGRDNANGAIMAVDELNNEDITLDGQKVKFQVRMEDDAADPKQGTTVAQKLGQMLGKYAVNELKGKTVAVIDDRIAYGQRGQLTSSPRA
jgi:ABC-type branched-subunit amino acid transport system substrate-binding protein